MSTAGGNPIAELDGWRGRFYSTILDEAHLYAAVRYVENNPLWAGMVKKAEDYLWSSAREPIDGSKDGIVSERCYLQEEINNWGAIYWATGRVQV